MIILHPSPPPAEHHTAEDRTAALLSLLPGLGHLYKGYVHEGLGHLCIGLPVSCLVGGLLGFATLGLGFLLPLAYAGMCAWQAYSIKRRHYRWGH
jgi:hypothetical protein